MHILFAYCVVLLILLILELLNAIIEIIDRMRVRHMNNFVTSSSASLYLALPSEIHRLWSDFFFWSSLNRYVVLFWGPDLDQIPTSSRFYLFAIARSLLFMRLAKFFRDIRSNSSLDTLERMPKVWKWNWSSVSLKIVIRDFRHINLSWVSPQRLLLMGRVAKNNSSDWKRF